MLSAGAIVGFGAGPLAVAAPAEGGLYIAGAGFSFKTAAKRAMSQNPGGRRFFLLSLPPETAALGLAANASLSNLRQRVVAANGMLLVCQRDVEQGRIKLSELVPGVVAVRGWPAAGSNEMRHGERYFPDENSVNLPADNVALRQLRSTCS
ncbi:hypothetical protein LNV09_16765 [Paucibacter sp. B2R-40]|uniref:hypothetical protein n=1 Tax=Paucibacter sp. B2R-40 TaxID=2893554 RepID=UPI0021E4C6A7|nr:hypothetical protein [Paucibacter sp. B2R-40]MCV2355797.1 hypothetical protein [Paucibacter sp. B2R-40]